MSSNHWIRASGAAKPYTGKVFVYDIETWGLNSQAFAFGCSRNINTGEEEVFYSPELARSYFEENAPCIVYSHNSFGFDLFSILNLEEAYQARKIAQGTNIYEIRHNKVKYRDSKHLFPMKLSALGDSFKMPKGETPIDFIEANKREITQEDISYCLLDCKILARGIIDIHDFYASSMGMSRHDTALPLTIASISYRIWCATSWPEHWGWIDKKSGKRQNAAKTDPYFNDTLNEAYWGGRTQLINAIPGQEVENVLEYDANSMYPFVMAHPGNLYPDLTKCWRVGATENALLNIINDPLYVCWANLEMYAPEGVERFLPVLGDDGRLDFNRSEFSGWLCEPEIRLALKEGWIIKEIHELNKSKGIRPFMNYINGLYELRKEYKAQGDSREMLSKMSMNSLYGRFGLRPKPTRIENPEDIEKAQKKKNYNERYELCFYDRKNMAYPYLLDHHTTSGSNSSQWFGFSAFVCSYARCVLAEAIIAGGEHALYSDTDSVHIREEGKERFEELISLGDELGQWKLETPVTIAKAVYFRKKAYTWYDKDNNKRKVKAKGVQVKNDKGEYLDHAGDMRKLQRSRTTVKLFSALRRGLIPGTELITEKRDSIFYEGD